ECGEEDYTVRLKDGTVEMHRPTDAGWLIEFERGDPLELTGIFETVEVGEASTAAPAPDAVLPPSTPIVLDREDQFRRAEEPYNAAEFSARGGIEVRDDTLHVTLEVTAAHPYFRPADAANPEWENENPDIHSDGIQVYVDYGGFYGWLIVPDDAS